MRFLKLFQKYFLSHQPADRPVKQTDFEMYLEDVDVTEYIELLRATELITKTLATVCYKDKMYDVLQIDKPSKAKDAKKLLIFAGVHGNEFAATLAVKDIVNDLQDNTEQYTAWNIRIITPLNPVGLAYQSRYDEDGKDINRDFKEFKTKGGKIQRDVIEQFKPDAIISLHEGPQDGFFVIAENTVSKELCGDLANNLKQKNIKVATKSFFGMKLANSIWRKNKAIYVLQKLFGIYTLGRFAYDRNIPLFTTESSWRDKDVLQRQRAHLEVVRVLIKTMYHE